MKQSALIPLISCAALAAGCAASPAATTAVTQTRAGFTDAALSPLEDLNLRKDDIPPVLEDIANPYSVSHALPCDEISVHLAELNAVLPPDWDAAREEEVLSLSDRAADTASDGVLGVVASEARGLIPYRGWVRRLSGANSHEKKVKSALERGNARRTYLKAIGRMKDCDGIPELAEAPDRRNPVDYRGDAPARQQPAPPQPTGPVDLRGPRTSEAQTSSKPSVN